MIAIFTILIISGIFLFGLVVVIPFTISNIYAIVPGSCPNTNFLWAHTYDNSRLKVLNNCVVVEGHLHGTFTTDEGDGDITFNVDVDPQFKDLLNQYNTKGMHVEIICWKNPDLSYIKRWGDYCKGVESKSHFPGLEQLTKTDHIRIIGKWVTDIGHAGQPSHETWNEIHPVEKVEKIK